MAHNVSFATRRKIFNFSERYYWFMHSPWAGGVMLVVFMVLALVLGNLPATKGWYYGILRVISRSASTDSPCRRASSIGSTTG